jgi:hypothetical protein
LIKDVFLIKHELRVVTGQHEAELTQDWWERGQEIHHTLDVLRMRVVFKHESVGH